MRVAIIGCGKIADKHVSQILRIPDCEIVGVCDREILMAGQLAERFNIKSQFDNVEELLNTVKPDVVHITTPPQSHHSLAKQCLEAGCHIYVEKPFTLNYQEAQELVGIAEKTGLKMTVGQETQFMPAARDMRRLIQEGYLGGPPVHIESVYCYELSDERYARVFLGDKNHWLRRLPGGLLQNIISHGIGKIVEYLPSDDVTVITHGFNSNFLERIGEPDIIDELRVIITDSQKTSAYFTFSSQVSPSLHQFRIYGPVNSLIADFEHQTLIKVPKKRHKSYLNQFIPPFTNAKDYSINGFRNIRRFLKNELHAESGIYFLISSFYNSIVNNESIPLSYRDILLISNIMEKIFNQIKL